MAYSSLFIVTLLIPYPSVQHFIWPLHWCLLADICNHTYIPECGTENEEDKYNRRLFIDECDLYEYNCDFETDYYPINYSSCFNIPPRPCPTFPPCPSIPPCPDHRYHNIVDHTIVEHTIIEHTTVEHTTVEHTTVEHINAPRRMYVKPTTLGVSLPMYMLKGKRRYSPTFRKKRRKTTQLLTKRSTVRKTIKKTEPTTTRTKILKKHTVKKNGRVFVKVIKAIIRNNPKKKKEYNHDDSDFLE